MFLNFICFAIGSLTGMIITCLVIAAESED